MNSGRLFIDATGRFDAPIPDGVVLEAERTLAALTGDPDWWGILDRALTLADEWDLCLPDAAGADCTSGIEYLIGEAHRPGLPIDYAGARAKNFHEKATLRPVAQNTAGVLVLASMVTLYERGSDVYNRAYKMLSEVLLANRPNNGPQRHIPDQAIIGLARTFIDRFPRDDNQEGWFDNVGGIIFHNWTRTLGLHLGVQLQAVYLKPGREPKYRNTNRIWHTATGLAVVASLLLAAAGLQVASGGSPRGFVIAAVVAVGIAVALWANSETDASSGADRGKTPKTRRPRPLD